MSTPKIAWVTGAGRGIGLATSRALLAAGHHVVMTDRMALDASALVEAQRRGRVTTAVVDVTDHSSSLALKERIEMSVGSISILVNNAGVSPKRSDGTSSGILDLSIEEWTTVLDVNLTAAMRLCQLVLPGMKAQAYGRIVNVASLAGRARSVVAGPSYMASKAGLIGLTRAIASEMGPFGITANSVAPGRILTEMALQAGTEVNDRYATQIPARRLGTPEEVGAAIAFLCSEQAGFINGAMLDINGGFFMP
ncbi:MAG: 3-oxoacyl-ACP reductase [Burkholderiales bacterium]|nr:3-oxoacyl-ACP reductase [Burkholderiales bacterium]